MRERVVPKEVKLKLALEKIREVCIDSPSTQSKMILRIIERAIGLPNILNFPDVKQRVHSSAVVEDEEVEHDPPGC